jgi:hypothetical protein
MRAIGFEQVFRAGDCSGGRAPRNMIVTAHAPQCDIATAERIGTPFPFSRHDDANRLVSVPLIWNQPVSARRSPSRSRKFSSVASLLLSAFHLLLDSLALDDLLHHFLHQFHAH